MRFDHAGRTFAIYRSPDDEYFATDGLCTHEQVHLADGLVMDEIIECPKHNGRFNYKTGEAKGRAGLRQPEDLSDPRRGGQGADPDRLTAGISVGRQSHREGNHAFKPTDGRRPSRDEGQEAALQDPCLHHGEVEAAARAGVEILSVTPELILNPNSATPRPMSSPSRAA